MKTVNGEKFTLKKVRIDVETIRLITAHLGAHHAEGPSTEDLLIRIEHWQALDTLWQALDTHRQALVTHRRALDTNPQALDTALI